MKRSLHKIIYALISLGAFVFSNVEATTYTWVGTTSGAWTNPLNWNPSTGVPSSTDDVVILNAGASISLEGNVVVRNFTSRNKSINLSSYTLSITGIATISTGSSIIGPGSLKVDDASSSFGTGSASIIGASFSNATQLSVRSKLVGIANSIIGSDKINIISYVQDLMGNTITGLLNVTIPGSADNVNSYWRGSNSFNGDITLTNYAPAKRLNLNYYNSIPNKFNGDLYVNNYSTNTLGGFNFNIGGYISSEPFNGNIFINNSYGLIYLGFNSANTKLVIPADKIVTVTGWSGGTLNISNLTTLGVAKPLTFNLAGQTTILGTNCQFNSPISFKAKVVTLTGNNFKDQVSIESFSQNLTANTISGAIDVTIPLDANNSNSFWGGTNLFNSSIVLNNYAPNKSWNLNYYSSTPSKFNGDLYINNFSTNTSGGFKFNIGDYISSDPFNGNIFINNSYGLIYLGFNSTNTKLVIPADKIVTVTGWSGGTLNISNLTTLGVANTLSFDLAGQTTILGTNCQFNSPVSFKAKLVTLTNNIFKDSIKVESFSQNLTTNTIIGALNVTIPASADNSAVAWTGSNRFGSLVSMNNYAPSKSINLSASTSVGNRFGAGLAVSNFSTSTTVGFTLGNLDQSVPFSGDIVISNTNGNFTLGGGAGAALSMAIGRSVSITSWNKGNLSVTVTGGPLVAGNSFSPTIFNFGSGGQFVVLGNATLPGGFTVPSGTLFRNSGAAKFPGDFTNNATVTNTGTMTVSGAFRNKLGSSITNNGSLTVLQNFTSQAAFYNQGKVTIGADAVFDANAAFTASSGATFQSNNLTINSRVDGPTSGKYTQLKAISAMRVGSEGNVHGNVDLCGGDTVQLYGSADASVTYCEYNKEVKVGIRAYAYSIPACQTSPLRLVVVNTGTADTLRLKNVVIQHRLGKGLSYVGLDAAQSSAGITVNYDANSGYVAFHLNGNIVVHDSAVVVYKVQADCQVMEDIGESNNGEGFDTLDIQVKQGTVDTLVRSKLHYYLRTAYMRIEPTISSVSGTVGQVLTRYYTLTQRKAYPNNRVAIQFKDSLPQGALPVSIRLFKRSDPNNISAAVTPIYQRTTGNKVNYSAYINNPTKDTVFLIEEKIKVVGCIAPPNNSTVNIRWGCDTTCFYKNETRMLTDIRILDQPSLRIDTSTILPSNKYCMGSDPNLVQPTRYTYTITNPSFSPAIGVNIALTNGGALTVIDYNSVQVKFGSTRLASHATVTKMASTSPSCASCSELAGLTITNIDTLYPGETITVQVDYRIACGTGAIDKWKLQADWNGVCTGHQGLTSFVTNLNPEGDNFKLALQPPNVSTISRNELRTKDFYQHLNGQFYPVTSKKSTTYPNINKQTGVVRIHLAFGEGIMIPGNLVEGARLVVFSGGAKTWKPYKAIADASAGTAVDGVTPRGANFYFRLSDVTGSVPWEDFLGKGRFYHTFQGYCPAAVPYTMVNYHVYLRSDSLCTSGCETQLAILDSNRIQVKCPGCIVPGPVLTSINIQRETYGFMDNNEDKQADLPFVKAGPDTLQTNPYMAAVGDTISLTLHGNLPNGDNNGGYEYDELTALLGGPLKYLYLEVSNMPIQSKTVRALDTLQLEIKHNGLVVGRKTFKTTSILKQSGSGTFFYCIPVDSISYNGTPYAIAVGDEFYAQTLYHFQRNYEYTEDEYIESTETFLPRTINVTLGIGNQPLTYKDEAPSVDSIALLDSTQKYLFYCEGFAQKFTFVPYDAIVSNEGYWEGDNVGSVCQQNITLRTYFSNKMRFPFEIRRMATFDTIRFIIPTHASYASNYLQYAGFQVTDTRDTILRNGQVIFLPHYKQWTNIVHPTVSDTVPLSGLSPSPGNSRYQMRGIQYARACNTNDSAIFFTFPKKIAAITLPDSGNPVAYPKLDLGSFLAPANKAGYKVKGDSVYLLYPKPVLQIFPTMPNISSTPAKLSPFTLYVTGAILAPNVFMDIRTKNGNRFDVTAIWDSTKGQNLTKPTGSQVFHLGNMTSDKPRVFRLIGTYTCKSPTDLKDTLMVRYGWSCNPNPMSAADAACAFNKLDTAYIYIEGAQAGIDLSGKINGPDSLDLCASNSFSYDMTPLDASVYNFHNELTLPNGVTVDSVAYVLNGSRSPVSFQVVNRKVLSVSDSAATLRGTGIKAGDRFSIRYALRFPCGFNAAKTQLKVSAYAFSYCGLRIPSKDSISTGFPSKVKGIKPTEYTLAVPASVALGCAASAPVQVNITPTKLSNVPGSDTLRILMPTELELTAPLAGAVRKIGWVMDTLKLVLDEPVKDTTQTISFSLQRKSGLAYCGTRDIQYDIISSRSVVCPGNGFACAVTFTIAHAASAAKLLGCDLSVPIVSGATGSCGNSSQSYTITNSYPSGTTFAWAVSSYANNVNLIVAPNTAGTQAQIAFGNEPGVDTLVVSAFNTSGCASAPLKLPITTNPLPFFQAGPIGSYCKGQVLLIKAKAETQTHANRMGIPPLLTTFTWGTPGAMVIASDSNSTQLRYDSVGVYPISYNALTDLGCSVDTSQLLNIKNLYCGACLGARDSSLIQNIPEMLIMSEMDANTYGGKVVLDGTFLLKNDITFKNGTFSLKPGTLLLVDSVFFSPRIGPSITLDNASLILNSATISGCATMWDGIVLEGNSELITDGTPTNYSKISDLYSIKDNYSASTVYNINRTVFENNWISIAGTLSDSIHIKSSIFTSDTLTFKPPLNRGEIWAGQGFPLEGHGYSSYHVWLYNLSGSNYHATIDSSLFENAYIGLLFTSNPQFGGPNPTYPPLFLGHSTFRNLGGVALTNGYTKWANNTIALINNSNEYGALLTYGAIMYGSYIYNSSPMEMIGNAISLDAPKDGHSGVQRTFLNNSSSYGTLHFHNNEVTGVSTGITTAYIADYSVYKPSLVQGNRFVDCGTALVYSGTDPYWYQEVMVPLDFSVPNACNSYTTTKSNSIGILLDAQVANDYTIGSSTAPAGNSFSGYDGSSSFGLYNQGQPFTYYYGTNESADSIVSGGAGIIDLRQGSSISNCSGQGYSNGVGRLAMSGDEEPNIHELQDSVRFKGTTPSRIKLFQSEISKYYTINDKLDSLGIYTKTLVNCNREAYYSFCLYLINKYTAMGDVSNSTAWKSYARQPNPNDKEINARISLSELMQNKPKLSVNTFSGYFPNQGLFRYSSSDSTHLANLANSGTSVAEGALGLLRIAYPIYTCNTNMTYNYHMYDSLNCNDGFAFARKASEEADLANKLWDAVPNPANNGTSIAYQVMDKNSSAHLEIFDLNAGLKLQVIKLNERMTKASVLLDLSNYKSGVYGYRFIVDDKVLAVKKLVVIK